MIKILVTNKLSGQVQESLLPSMEAANAWIEECELKEAWGKPFHIINHLEQVNSQEPLIFHHEEIVTPVADLVIHHEESTDANDEIVPAWDEVIPQAPIVTPARDESIPQPDIIIPAWIEEIEAEYTIQIIDITDEVNANKDVK